MKVLQINSVCGVGSTGHIATDLHKTLIEQGHESHIAFGRDEPKNCENAIRIGSRFDNYAHVALTRLFDRHGFGSAATTKNFIQKVTSLDPDIIHLHNIHGYYINIKILFDYLKNSHKPVVWTLHDCWSFTGHCSHFSYVHCDKWLEVCKECPQKKSYPASYLLDNSKSNYYRKRNLFTSIENMTIVTPSKWLADLVRKSFLFKTPAKVIHTGIDTNIFKPIDSSLVREKLKLGHRFLILGVASIWSEGYRKGLNYFVKLSELMADDCLIILVGLDEKQITNLPSNIIGIKLTTDIDELVSLYSVANVFVNPTMEDNFPTVNLEALACGTPVITFDTGGSREAIKDNCGYVVEKGNVYDMKLYIEKVRRIGTKYYSENCIRSVIDNFNKNDRLKDYMDLYKDSKKMNEAMQ